LTDGNRACAPGIPSINGQSEAEENRQSDRSTAFRVEIENDQKHPAASTTVSEAVSPAKMTAATHTEQGRRHVFLQHL
jgi:hypothetical protein